MSIPVIAHNPVNFAQKYSLFTEQWQPKVIAQMNDYQFKLARLEGDFYGTATPTPTKPSS